MPPPNITGQLHMGHAFFATLQDTIARTKRLRGYDTLWQPGTDHAGLATHEKIMDAFKADRNPNPSREAYETRAQTWQDQHQSTISQQLRLMGASCDWNRERYTLDKGMEKATKTAFTTLYHKGLITQRAGQWYLNMEDMAADLIGALKNGIITIHPAHAQKSLLHFLENIEPWCLSRQIPWGHRMPLWETETGSITAAHTQEEAAALLKSTRITQLPDSLDTWFSSSLWPFAILGWPDDTPDMRRYYPASLIETGADILFPWCGKMLMMGKALTGIYPFTTIYLHGMIRDSQGRKMSKSLGNGTDPRTLIDTIGCDPLRLALLEHTTAGQDIPLMDSAFESARHLTNKLWQAARFFEGHWKRAGYPNIADLPQDITADQKHFLETIEHNHAAILDAIETYEFREAALLWRHIIKDILCDGYIETAKDDLYQGDKRALYAGLIALDKILESGFPICPFITERITQSLPFAPLHTR